MSTQRLLMGLATTILLSLALPVAGQPRAKQKPAVQKKASVAPQPQPKKRAAELDKALAAIAPLRTIALKYKKTSPENYVAYYRKYLYQKRRLVEQYADASGQADVANEYMALAEMARFRLHKPAIAVLLYEQARQLGTWLGDAAMADVSRFDLEDKAKAIEHYQRALQSAQSSPPSNNELENAFTRWVAKWLAAELSYLQTGNTFKGPLNREDVRDLDPIIFYRFYVNDSRSLESSLPEIHALNKRVAAAMEARTKLTPAILGLVEKRLEQLPASNLLLLDTMRLTGLLPSADKISRFMTKNDPTGYVSAHLYAMILRLQEEVDQSDGSTPPEELSTNIPGLNPGKTAQVAPLLEAANQFSKQTGIALRLQADPRLSTPTDTWTLLLEALKKNDVDTAVLCLTDDLRVTLKAKWSQMSATELRKLADSFEGFSISPEKDVIREAHFTRRTENGSETRSVYFVNEEGEWKIKEM